MEKENKREKREQKKKKKERTSFKKWCKTKKKKISHSNFKYNIPQERKNEYKFM